MTVAFFGTSMVGFWPWFFLVILMMSNLSKGLTDEEIEEYLTRYIVKEEQFTGQLIYWRQPWFEKYTLGKIRAPGLNETLREVLEVSVAAQATAQLTFGAKCNRSFEAHLGFPRPGQLVDFQRRMAMKGAQGFQFCNFYQYLLCHLDTNSLERTCDCLPNMSWSVSKASCVFREGEVCRNVQLEPKFRHFNWAATESSDDDFESSVIRNHCEDSLVCREESSTCATHASESSLLSIEEILGHVAGPCGADSGNPDNCTDEERSILAEVVHQFVAELNKPNAYHLLEILSLEIRAAKRHLPYGYPCDEKLDAPLEAQIARDGPDVNPNWYSYNDPIRQRYLRNLVQSSGRVCDHFHLLTCQDRKCSCGPNLRYDTTTQKCVLKTGVICSQKFQTKEFSFRLSASSIVNSFNSLYQTEIVPCYEQCTELEPGFRVCTRAQDPPTLHSQLEQRMTLGLGDLCNELAEHEVFKDRSNLEPANAMSLFQRDLERVVHDDKIHFCQITKHAFCIQGTCTCLQPFVQEGDRCVATLHDHCHEHTDAIRGIPANLYDVLQLAINVHQQDHLEIFCAGGLSCKEANPWDKLKFCSCFNGQFGDNCDSPPSKHLLFLAESGLSQQMLSREGQRALAEAHENLGDLEKLMSLRSGQECDQGVHDHLEEIMESLRNIESLGCSDSEFCVPRHFKRISEESRQLRLKGPTFCDRLNDFICLNEMCQCPGLSFEEKGQCHLDLGANCPDRAEGPNRGHLSRCRTGTVCVNSFCQLKSSSVQKRWYPAEKHGESYVIDIELNYAALHQGELEDLRTERRLPDGAECNWEMEDQLLIYMNDIDPLLRKRNWNHQLEMRLQRIRLFQNYEDAAEDLRLAAPFCNPNSTCKANDGRCESYLTPSVRKAEPDYADSSASVPIIHIKWLLVYLLVSIIATRLNRNRILSQISS